jgi:hypothetical protein
LIEDEVAVVRAFEQGQGQLRLPDQTFDVSQAYEGARRALVEEVGRAAERVLLQRFARRGELCRGLAVIGGGAAVAGQDLAERLATSSRFDGVWIAKGASFLLVEGARRQWASSA